MNRNDTTKLAIAGSRRRAPFASPTRLSASVLAVSLLLSSCGTGRSVEAFCDTMISEQDRIVREMEEAQALADQQDDELVSVLIGLGSSLEAIGELRTYTRKLADTAPSEIQTDAEAVADSMDAQFEAMKDSASNPLGALASSLVEGFTSAGSMDRVDSFARANCGRGI